MRLRGTAMLAAVAALAVSAGGGTAAGAGEEAPPWSPATYPDEAGFQARTRGMLPVLAGQREAALRRAMARSACPDTGLPVYTWALAGETVISPYTGRAYRQGDTGYFGPKRRDPEGRILAFGGDPLKQALPPLTASLMATPDDPAARAYLAIPGNLSQQYHFAAANWARHYGLLAEQMGSDWKRAFAEAVAGYNENRRPSDGAREYVRPLSRPHDLVGEPGELLGGNVQDGGTENHKTMWRTSGLLYAQWLGPEARVSGVPAPEAERRITEVLTGYLSTCLTVGNGEYDSSTYYPHSLRGYLNLYDFSPKPETRALAKAQLDYYLATYGLKVFNGVHVGAVKRGWAGDGADLGEMDAHLWAWTGGAPGATAPADPASLVTSLHQATTKYRPDRTILNILTKDVPLPFEARMARPTYHSKDRNAFQEYFYCDRAFALGSVAMTRVDNPTQQTVWSLGCRDAGRTLVFGGGQPRYRHPEGHSPYTQTLQKRGALLVVTAPTRPAPRGGDLEATQRAESAAEALADLPPPADERPETLAAWWAKAPRSNATWLFVPRAAGAVAARDGAYAVEAGEAVVLVRSVGGKPYWIAPKEVDALPKEMDVLKRYRILVVPTAGAGGVSGYALDVAARPAGVGAAAFLADALAKTRLSVSGVGGGAPTVDYASLAGDRVTLRYRPGGLRAAGSVGGKEIDWASWAGGAVIESPYVTVSDGRMTVSDGRTGYTLRATEGAPAWQAR